MDSQYTRKRQPQFRGPTSSEDYNRLVEENYRDLTTLFNRAAKSDRDIRRLSRRFAKEQWELARMLSNLEDRLDSLEEETPTLHFYDGRYIDTDRFDDDSDFAVDETDRLTLQEQYGILTLPKQDTSSVSRVLYPHDGEDIVPDTLHTRVVGVDDTADNEDEALIDESPVRHAIKRRPGLVWERNVVVDEPHENGAECYLYVEIPAELFTVSETNAVVLTPFPAFGTTIKEVAYTTKGDPALRDGDGYTPLNEDKNHSGDPKAVGWVPPGAWDGDHEGEDHAVDVGPRIYYHPPEQITAVRVRLKQDRPYEDGGKYVYSYGLSRFDVRKDKFLSEGSAILRFDAPEGESINSIDQVTPHIWNVPLVEHVDVFDYNVIWEEPENSGTYTTTPVSGSSRVWIDVTLKGTRGWTPALSGLEISYS